MKNTVFAVITAATLLQVSCKSLTNTQNAALIEAGSTALGDVAAGKSPKETALDAAAAGLKKLKDGKAVVPAVAPVP
jgi:hypothetical protein